MNRDIKRGDIFWVDPNPYKPAVGHMQQAGRPAIVVSNDENNLHSPTLEIVYLTTKPRRNLPTHCTIRSSDRISTALCEQVTTISKVEQVKEYIGTCTQQEMEMVSSCIAISLGLDFKAEPEKTSEDDAYTRSLEQEIERLKASLENYKITASERNLAATRAQAREELLMQLYKEAIDM